MSFETHLNNLRSKPEHIQKHIAFWSSLAITGLIFIFWISSFNFSGNITKTTVATTVNKTSSPLTSLTASVGSFFGDIKDLIFSPRKVSYSEVIVTPGK